MSLCDKICLLIIVHAYALCFTVKKQNMPAQICTYFLWDFVNLTEFKHFE